MLSFTHFVTRVHWFDEDCPIPIDERAHRFARKAVQLNPNLPIARAHLGLVLTYQGNMRSPSLSSCSRRRKR
jgi:hypothetical protein